MKDTEMGGKETLQAEISCEILKVTYLLTDALALMGK
jgi:hypothetical protein